MNRRTFPFTAAALLAMLAVTLATLPAPALTPFRGFHPMMMHPRPIVHAPVAMPHVPFRFGAGTVVSPNFMMRSSGMMPPFRVASTPPAFINGSVARFLGPGRVGTTGMAFPVFPPLSRGFATPFFNSSFGFFGNTVPASLNGSFVNPFTGTFAMSPIGVNHFVTNQAFLTSASPFRGANNGLFNRMAAASGSPFRANSAFVNPASLNSVNARVASAPAQPFINQSVASFLGSGQVVAGIPANIFGFPMNPVLAAHPFGVSNFVANVARLNTLNSFGVNPLLLSSWYANPYLLGGYGLGGYGAGMYGGGYGGYGGGMGYGGGDGMASPAYTAMYSQGALNPASEQPQSSLNVLSAYGIPNNDGQLAWPLGLRVLGPSSMTDGLRARIDSALPIMLGQRAHYGHTDATLVQETSQAIDGLRHQLSFQSTNLASNTYMDAARFLQRLQELVRKLQ